MFDSELVAASAAGSVGFLGLGGFSDQDVDRELGYSGADRFVCFYYEPCSDGVRWRDSQATGTGCGRWSSVFGQIEALAEALGMSVGNDAGQGDHVLLVDRESHQARFAFREEAQEFLARRAVA